MPRGVSRISRSLSSTDFLIVAVVEDFETVALSLARHPMLLLPMILSLMVLGVAILQSWCYVRNFCAALSRRRCRDHQMLLWLVEVALQSLRSVLWTQYLSLLAANGCTLSLAALSRCMQHRRRAC